VFRRPIIIAVDLECPCDGIHWLFIYSQIVAKCHKNRVRAIINRRIEALPRGNLL
jgi:hypothetical protein